MSGKFWICSNKSPNDVAAALPDCNNSLGNFCGQWNKTSERVRTTTKKRRERNRKILKVQQGNHHPDTVGLFSSLFLSRRAVSLFLLVVIVRLGAFNWCEICLFHLLGFFLPLSFIDLPRLFFSSSVMIISVCCGLQTHKEEMASLEF